MTSLGMGTELDSSSIKPKMPEYPKACTVEVTPRVTVRIRLMIGSLVTGAPSITTSSKKSKTK
jgi:hypothetical protein